LLAHCAAFDIFSDIGSHARPPVVSFDEFFGFRASRVPCSRVIVMEGEDAVTEIWGNIGTILIK
jgi:hypothetical protein